MNPMSLSGYRALAAVVTLFTSLSQAKDAPFQVITWPDSGQPLVRFTFSKFKEVGGLGRERTYVTETTAENLSGKVIGGASLSLYVFDKSNVRIGEGYINLSNVGPGQTVKFQVTLAASGSPASLTVSAHAPQAISITVNSVPQGAALKVDGKDAGTTPKMVEVTVGKHLLEFSKDGFNSGKFPLEISPRDVSGGNVSYELGVSAHDTFELRDGTLLTGDLVSVGGMEITIRVGGVIQTLDRNKVKRILLTEREPAP